MSDVNRKKVDTIVDQALDLPKEERKTFIESQCGDNKRLKNEVTLLLESIYDSEGWLENPEDYKKEFYDEISDDVEYLSTDHAFVGSQVGSYTIREKIGEGGMGTVYRAERRGGEFDHQVAIKIIRRGRASEVNIRRFRREQRILAGLNHPGIARLYDGGITEEGFPYIIMEHVSGIPIDEYCRENDCSITEEIALFEQVLEAIRYAHENLIIHRDLKPDNILVDEAGTIKILDFGISKLLEEDSDPSLTKTGTQLLTPRYAAPEQIRQENITTATDLYALGVVFYELLAGTGPYDLEEATSFEAKQIILRQEPVKPSAKVSSAASHKKLKGDLDAIALKAIRKEPDRRYRVANEFLDDLKSYQTGIPISAHQDSFKYRSQKFISRHKQGVAIAAGILLLVVGFVVFYSWRITEERNQAKLEAQKAEEVTDFLTRIFEGSNPTVAKADSIPIRNFLERGVNRINEMEGQSEVKAALLTTMGRVYSNLGEYEKSDTLLQEALKLSKEVYEDPHEDLANSYVMKAANEKELDNFAAAESLYKKGINILEKLENRPDSLYSGSLSNLALLYEEIGKHPKAIPIHKKAVALDKKRYPEGHKEIGISLNHLAVAQEKNGAFQKALKNHKKSLEIFNDKLGKGHKRTAITTHNLAILYRSLGRIDKAIPLIKEALKMKKAIYGNEHIVVVSSLAGLGHLYRETGQIENAISTFEKTMDIVSNTHGDSSMYAGILSFSLGASYLQDGNFLKAKRLFRKSKDILERALGPEGAYVAIPKHLLGKLFLKQEKLSEAQDEFRETKAILIKNYDKTHPYYGGLMKSLGRLKIAQDSLQKARAYLNKSIEVFEQKLPDTHWKLAESRLLLGKVLYHQENYSESRQLLKQNIPHIRKYRGDDDSYVKSSAEILKMIPSTD
ncbi:serine/threonine-protein kinase [Fodinibius halophilus]|uniref:Serine/threonine protein kinase n=1 Tax=Fodinibius halophilus TaxID=1736908 RepID=A0A6M1TH77_9BACT|nr:serine/threonine-protein kinase [Fodinibius halophilus]NGP89472.1 serine/threonine protein kinase [Fodinibius halophilus]